MSNSLTDLGVGNFRLISIQYVEKYISRIPSENQYRPKYSPHRVQTAKNATSGYFFEIQVFAFSGQKVKISNNNQKKLFYA